MFPPRWFVPVDILIQFVMALISIGIAVYAYRGSKWVKERSLYYLSISFAMLAAGFLSIGLVLTYSYVVEIPGPHQLSPPLPVIDLGFWLYYMFSIAAFAILVYAYAKNIRGASVALAAFGIVLSALLPLMETVIIILLVCIVVAQVVHYSKHRSKVGFMVTASFGLILVSHILVATSGAESDQYVAGKIVQLVGFLALLVVLLLMRGPDE